MTPMPGDAARTAVYRSREGEISRPTEDEALRASLADAEGVLWLDLAIGSQDDSRVLSDVFRFHHLTIEDCVSPHVDPAKIDDHGEYLFVVVQTVGEFSADRPLPAMEVEFYLGPNYVVSCHRQPLPAIGHYMDRCLEDPLVLSRGSDWLLHGILDALVDEYLPVVDAVDDTIDFLEESVLRTPDNRALQQIMMVRRNALRLRRAVTPQRDIMARLSRGEYSQLVRPATAIYYRDIYDHLVRVEYLIEALRDLADGALNTYLSVVSNRLNEVMKVLTAAATIFLPLTLISGIYGMNFVEGGVWPPFESEWGFGLVVGGMLAIAIGLLAYFRLRHWI
jgi:magnesium transporter